MPSPLLPGGLHGLGAAGEAGELGHQDPTTNTGRLLLETGFCIRGLTMRCFVEAGERDHLENNISKCDPAHGAFSFPLNAAIFPRGGGQGRHSLMGSGAASLPCGGR